jgi:hypothetical protein
LVRIDHSSRLEVSRKHGHASSNEWHPVGGGGQSAGKIRRVQQRDAELDSDAQTTVEEVVRRCHPPTYAIGAARVAA